MIDIDLTYGIQSVWKEDEEYQTACLSGILSAIRRINDTDIAKLHEDYLKEIGAFFVHNDSYITEHFGPAIKEPKYGMYNSDGRCYLCGRLAIPLRTMDDCVRGFVGYSKKPDDLDPNDVYVKYLYPPKYAFSKSRYMFITSQEYRKALEEQYICIVDGLFDKIILQCLGINAVSLCGSSLTSWHKYYLSFIKNKIVVADNDLAGRRLASYCKYAFDNCVELIQAETGDIDSFIRTPEHLLKIKNTILEMKHEGFLISKILPTETRKEKLI